MARLESAVRANFLKFYSFATVFLVCLLGVIECDSSIFDPGQKSKSSKSNKLTFV